MTIAKQAEIQHPLHTFGYRKPPHWLWRLSRRAYIIAAAANDIRLILIGRLTLHRAWQAGYDAGTKHEFERTVINGGR